MSSAPKNSSSTDRLPPLIYVALVGFVAWMVLAAWGFAGPGYADVALTVVTGFLALVVAIPFILWRVGRANRDGSAEERSPDFDDWSSGRELLYRIDPDFSRSSGKLSIEVGYRERTMNGEWGKMKSRRIPTSALSTLKDPADQQILAMLSGARDGYWPGYEYSYGGDSVSNRFALPTALQHLVMPLMCATGRCVWRLPGKNAELQVIRWDDEGAWHFTLSLQLDEATQEYVLRGFLRRAAEEMRPAEEMEVASAMLATEGIVLGPDLRAARFDSHGARIWIDALRKSGEFRIPAADSNEFVAHLLELPTPPRLDLPKELQFERIHLPPTPHLIVRKSGQAYSSRSNLEVDLLFDYHGVSISSSDRREGIYDRGHNGQARRFVERDVEGEKSAIQLLKPLGFRTTRDYNDNPKLTRVFMQAISGRKLQLDQDWYTPTGMQGWSHVIFRRDRDKTRHTFSLDFLLNHLEG